jgi:hypothetical protein
MKTAKILAQIEYYIEAASLALISDNIFIGIFGIPPLPLHRHPIFFLKLLISPSCIT